MNEKIKENAGICISALLIVVGGWILYWALFGGGVRDDGGAAERAHTGIDNAQREQQQATESVRRIRSGLEDGEHRADSIERRIETGERRASAAEISVNSAQSRVSQCRSLAEDSERRIEKCLRVCAEVRKTEKPD